MSMEDGLSDILARLSAVEQALGRIGVAETIPHGGTNQVYKAGGWGSLVDADVDAAAAIALSKLAPGSAGYVKSSGSAISAGNSIALADVPTMDVAHIPALHQVAAARSFSGTTGSATIANINGTSGKVTITSTGGDMIGLLIGYASNNNANVVQQVYLQLDSNGWGGNQFVNSFASNSNVANNFATAEVYTGQAAGSHTLWAGHANISASGTMSTVGILLLLLELYR